MKYVPLILALALAACGSARSPLDAEVHVRIADFYAQKLRRCADARRHYELAARMMGAEPWTTRAREGIMNCPDYFPIALGRTWVYGDSASGGRNMKLESDVTEAAAGSGEIRSVLYAGPKRVRVQRAQYEKKDWQVAEILPTGAAAAVLRYPFRAGRSWTAARGDERLSYVIEDDSAHVVTAAGTFDNCLKVREFNPNFPNSWKYDYYAPFIGRVKTTVGGPGFENPNTELIRYSAGL